MFTHTLWLQGIEKPEVLHLPKRDLWDEYGRWLVQVVGGPKKDGMSVVDVDGRPFAINFRLVAMMTVKEEAKRV